MRRLLAVACVTAVWCIAAPAVAQPRSETALDARERAAFDKLVRRVEQELLTPPAPNELADELFDRWNSLSAQHLHDFEAFGDAHPRWRLRAQFEQARVAKQRMREMVRPH